MASLNCFNLGKVKSLPYPAMSTQAKKISEIKNLAEKRCPAVFCLANHKLSVENAKQ